MRISRTPVKPTTSCCARGQSTPALALLATSAKIDEEFSPADPVGRNGWAPLGIDDGKTVRSNQRGHTTYLKNIKILLHCSLADYHGAVEECPAGVGAGQLSSARTLAVNAFPPGWTASRVLLLGRLLAPGAIHRWFLWFLLWPGHPVEPLLLGSAGDDTFHRCDIVAEPVNCT